MGTRVAIQTPWDQLSGKQDESPFAVMRITETLQRGSPLGKPLQIKDAVARLNMRRMRRCLALALVIWLPAATTGAAPGSPPSAPATASGAVAPDYVVAEIQQALDAAVRSFDAMDSAGVLAHVSDQYRTSPLTKPLLAEQLRALFALHDQVRARVRIDEVRLVGEHAWIYSTGTVTGRLRWTGRSIPVLAWEHELEVARREGGRWRLFGYQQ